MAVMAIQKNPVYSIMGLIPRNLRRMCHSRAGGNPSEE